MTLAPPDPRALLTPPSTAPAEEPTEQPAGTSTAAPPRGGAAGLIAELGHQHRANGQARRERREHTRDRRAARRATRRGEKHPHDGGTGFGAWLRAVPGSLQEGGVQLGYAMALCGSGIGQLSWWSAQFPLLLAASFALSFEAIMIGSSRRARRLRRQGHAAGGLRLIAWSAAAFGAGLNWVHLSDPATTLVLGHQVVHGSPSLGAAFAAFTALGFGTHEVSTSSDVRTELIRAGYLRPLGLRRWLPPFTGRAWRARLLLIEDPDLDVAGAWAQAARPHGRRRGWSLRRHRTTDVPAPASAEPSPSGPLAADRAEVATDPTPAAPAGDEHGEHSAATSVPTDPADRPFAEEAIEPRSGLVAPRSASTDSAAVVTAPAHQRGEPAAVAPGVQEWVDRLRPVAQAMMAQQDWISLNEIRGITAAGPAAQAVGKGKASKIMKQLEAEFPHHPTRQGCAHHGKRLEKAMHDSTMLAAA